ncbi:glutamyl-tRNA synthetase [Polyplosphaeria fusca]|uniref:Glutamate--tRNA ligase, mitochondrial n=1 Tax=Polyplosphaeria fusca TaxID=682080 RepID=A0A9P4V340_9PLEO|nr:glutamyl-tRNA synthetase [Polyplosphaeria fusca]
MTFPLLLRPRLASYTCRSCLLRLSSASRRSIASTAKNKKKPPPASVPETPARTRFAPSPTGYLHLGSLRTALFNYLLAKRTGGQFLLRIEDTDQKRTVPDAEQRLFRDLRWAGLEWDEGPEVGGPYGPYKQSERSDLYREHAQKLLDTGHAYRCFCSAERLNQLAESRHKLGMATDYDRTCYDVPQAQSDERAAKGEKYVVRLKVDSLPAYTDLIYGTFKAPPNQGRKHEHAFEDPILLKSDGLPTYHLANVVDDHHMRITHVIRGLEWMPSTPKHVALYNAFSWTPPLFAHVGLLVDEQGNKLSKRNFDTDISAFRQMEVFPETLVNFAALLGWSHGRKSDVMDMKMLIEEFKPRFTKGNTTVTFGKLQFLQRKHAALRVERGGPELQKMVNNVVRLLQDPDGPYQEWQDMHFAHTLDTYVADVIRADGENYTNANEFLYRNSFLFMPIRNPRSMTDEEGAPLTMQRFEEVTDWNKNALAWTFNKSIVDEFDSGLGLVHKDYYAYLRKALTGAEEGMRIYDLMMLLGREETLARLGVDV